MARLFAAACVIASAVGSAAAPVPKDAPPSFYPTAVGTKWVYDNGGRELTHEITKAEPKDGVTRLSVAHNGNASDVTTFDVGRTEVVKRTTGPFTLDKVILKLPLRERDEWAVNTPVQNRLQSDSGRLVVGKQETITVPAGTYRATRVDFVVTQRNGQPLPTPDTYTQWYAAGVGEVRLVHESSGHVRVLKSFTARKK